MADIQVDKNENIYFVDESTGIQIEANYQLVKKWSNLINTIQWAPNEVKKLTIPHLSKYQQSDTNKYLNYIIDRLHQPTPTLRVAINSYTPGLKTVTGNIFSLQLYLILCLRLQINILIDEIAETISSYIPSLDEVVIYYDIYTGILISDKVNGLTKLIITLSTFTPFVINSYSLKTIIQNLISDESLPLYNRYLLTFQCSLPPPKDMIDAMTARRLYSITEGVICPPSIQLEIAYIEKSKRHLIKIFDKYINDSIDEFLVDSTVDEESTNRTQDLSIETNSLSESKLNFFYVNGITSDNKIDLGTVNVHNKIYYVKLNTDKLFTKDNLNYYFEKSTPLTLLNRFEYLKNDYQKILGKIIRLDHHIIMHSNDNYLFFDYFQHIYHEDTRYREYLRKKGRLSEKEISFLERRRAESVIDLSVIKLRLLDNLDLDERTAVRNLYIYSIVNLTQLIDEEYSYYQSVEGEVLEELRVHDRLNFFSSWDRYGGLVVILKDYNILSVEGSQITLNLVSLKMPYHTTVLNLISTDVSDEEIIARLPTFQYTSPDSVELSTMIIT
jgi:hypothetical protein